jgi:3-hydroxyisobutyrate dehydrogenase
VKVGFVGTGRLGRHLAAGVLRAGFPLVVHDRSREAAEPLLQAGATWADSIGELDVDVAITCLPSVAALDAVVPQLLAARPRTWIDSSTNGPDDVRRRAALAAEHGVAVIEAPVTGGVHKAAAGEITVLAGGDAELVEAHRPLLEALGNPVLHVGELGQAATLKVITNMLAFVHLVAAGDALMLAKRAGIDLRTAFEGISASSGTSFVHETESQVILNGSYDIGFTIELALKDLGFARQLGEEHDVPLELEAVVERLFLEARDRYGASAWSPMVVKLLEDELGTDLRAPGFPPTLER